MGNGTVLRKKYETTTGYYCVSDYDEKLGGDFKFLVVPLIGMNDERFFYVQKKGTLYEITGEGYFYTFTSPAEHKKRVKDELKGKTLLYYHVDSNFNIIRKEKGISFKNSY